MLILPLAHRALRLALGPLGARSRTTTVCGRRVHFYEIQGKGDAPTAVLLHGMGGAASGWMRILGGVARLHRRVLVPDLPGFGLSELAKGEVALDANELFAVTHDFVRAEAGGPAVLIGNSLGGALATTLAIVKPELVAGLGLLSPAGAPMTAAQVLALRNDFLGGSMRDAARIMKRLFYRLPVSMYLFAPDLAEHWASQAVARVLDSHEPDIFLDPGALSRLRMPILLLWGDAEKILPADGIEHFRAHLPPHARIEVLERCGHVAQVERPRVVVDRLSWLAQQVAAAAPARTAA